MKIHCDISMIAILSNLSFLTISTVSLYRYLVEDILIGLTATLLPFSFYSYIFIGILMKDVLCLIVISFSVAIDSFLFIFGMLFDSYEITIRSS